MGRESTSSQMLLFGRYMLYFGKEFDIQEKLTKFDSVTKEEVESVIKKVFKADKIATATVGPKRTSLKI
jgi:predicted Zn-dependent peptidase